MAADDVAGVEDATTDARVARAAAQKAAKAWLVSFVSGRSPRKQESPPKIITFVHRNKGGVQQRVTAPYRTKHEC